MSRRAFQRTVATFAMGLGLLLALSPVVHAQDDHKWIIRANWVRGEPSNDSGTIGGEIGQGNIEAEYRANPGDGFGLELERLFNPRVGAFVSAIFADFEGEIEGREVGQASTRVKDSDSVDYYTINLGLNYHFTPNRRVDVYAGAFLGVFSHDSVTLVLPGIDEQVRLDFDDQLSYGLNAGLDILFGASRRGLFHLGAKWMRTDLKSTKSATLEQGIDPLFFELGLGYRF